MLNAKDASSSDSRASSLAREIQVMKDLGLKPTELDLRNHFGRPERLKQRLAETDLVWVRGGNTFVLRQAMKQSGAEEILVELLRKDEIVYGSFSAGVCVLAPSLRGLEIVDDPNATAAAYGEKADWEGLGFLTYAVAPHYRSDHPA